MDIDLFPEDIRRIIKSCWCFMILFEEWMKFDYFLFNNNIVIKRMKSLKTKHTYKPPLFVYEFIEKIIYDKNNMITGIYVKNVNYHYESQWAQYEINHEKMSFILFEDTKDNNNKKFEIKGDRGFYLVNSIKTDY